MFKPTAISFTELPRQLPLNLKLSVWFANIFFLFGFVFTLMGGITAGIILSKADLKSFVLSDNFTKNATGTITDVKDCNSSENKHTIYRFDYTFTTEKGSNYTGHSFSTSTGLQKGDEATIEYDEEKPEHSMIKGMRTAEFPIWVVLLVLIFPFIGICFLISNFVKAKKNLNILTNGILTTGKFISKTATSTKINNQTVYKVTFEFIDAQKTPRRAEVKTHHPHKLQDEAQEPVVYLPEQTENAVMLDVLPKIVRRFFEGNG